jgi:hypothetical protein
MKLTMKLTIGLAIAAACLVVISQGRGLAPQNSARTPAAASTLPVLAQIAPVLTVPANGDVNPYGVAYVPAGFPAGGTILAGDILVSNFNNSANLQGSGTTIVSRSPNGQMGTFFQGSPGLGLTTALGVLSKGLVLVGNVATRDGTSATIQTGSLLVINNTGQLVATITDPTLDSPWDLTIQEKGQKATVFVSNVISGTVTRLDISTKHDTVTILSKTQIASGYLTAPNAAALVVGPTGLAFDSANDILYVASTGDNKIYKITGASTAQSSSGTGTVVYSDSTHLHGPLGLVLAPNGNLITSNGDAINADPTQNSEIVEFTTTGTFVSQFPVDTVPGAAFGIAMETIGGGFAQFAAVDDNTNSVSNWIVRTQ